MDDQYYAELSQTPNIWIRNDSRKDYGYPVRHEGKKKIFLHREVARLAQIAPSEQTDHRDGDPLNAQEENLRAATRSQNIANSKLRADSTTGYKGVTWHKRVGKYYVQVKFQGRMAYSAYYTSALEAAKSYDAEVTALFGEFAVTNKSLGLY